MLFGFGRVIGERWPTIFRVGFPFDCIDDDEGIGCCCCCCCCWEEIFIELSCSTRWSGLFDNSEIRSRFHQKSWLKRVIQALSSRSKYRSINQTKLEEFLSIIIRSSYQRFQTHSSQYQDKSMHYQSLEILLQCTDQKFYFVKHTRRLVHSHHHCFNSIEFSW